MRLIATMVCLLLCYSLQAQDSTSVSIDSSQVDSSQVVNPKDLGKLERKVYELEMKVQKAMAERETMREQAHASTEPEAYSKVATASIKISKLQQKLNYARNKLNLSLQKARKKQLKEEKKNQEFP